MVLKQRNTAHGDESIAFPLKTKQYNIFVLNTLAYGLDTLAHTMFMYIG